MSNRLPFSVLSFRDFRLFWLASLVYNMGTQMQVVAINWQMYALTKSAFSLGLLGIAGFAPILVLALFSGLVADMVDRKKILMVGQLVMLFATLLLGLTTFSHIISPIFLYIAMSLSAIVNAFTTPARQAIVPSLAPKQYLPKAFSMNSVMWQTATIVGPTVAGFAIASLSVGSVYFITGLFIVLAVYLLGQIALVPQEKTQQQVGWDAIKEGITFIKNTPIIYATMLLDFFATFFASATVLLPLFAKDILHVDARGLGILYAAPAIGSLCMGLIFSSISHKYQKGVVLLIGVSLYGVATIAFGLSHWFFLSLLCLMGVGSGDMISVVIRQTARQLATPDYLRGRMIGINMIFFTGGPYLGEAEAGITAGMFGGPLSVVLGGLGTLLAVLLLAAWVPVLRTYKAANLSIE